MYNQNKSCENCSHKSICKYKEDFIYGRDKILSTDTAREETNSVHYAKDNKLFDITINCVYFDRSVIPNGTLFR